VVEGVAEDMVEVAGCVDAAIGHEVVDVVDDDEGGLESADVLFDFSDEVAEVLAENSEDVEAHEVELAVIEMKGVFHLLIELSAGIGAVDGVDPEDAGCGGLAGRTGFFGRLNGVYFEGGGLGITTGEVGTSDHLCKVMGVAGVATCEIGGLVLLDDGLLADGDEGMCSELAEVGVVVEETLRPGVIG